MALVQMKSQAIVTRICVSNSLAIHPVVEMFQFKPQSWTNVAIYRALLLEWLKSV